MQSKAEQERYYRRMRVQGLVTIPKELRETWGWEIGEPIEITIEGDRIIIRRVLA